MAMIIELNRVVDTTQDEAVADEVRQPREAEVILFPGVRYERWSEREQVTDETSAADAARAQAYTTRDWLEV